MRVPRLVRPRLGRGLAVLMVTGASVLCASACASASTPHKSSAKAPIKVFVYSDVTVPAPLPAETFQQLLPAAVVK